MLQGSLGCGLVAGEVDVGDLGDAESLQCSRKPRKRDIVTRQEDPIGLDPKGIPGDGCPRGPDSCKKLSPADSHPGKLAPSGWPAEWRTDRWLRVPIGEPLSDCRH
jgi:hypothetical protein